ncbi:segregation and condensation protein A [Salinicoccus bachuensis]|uniref:Segregation and condensation protein A n=1 Tax=Salinicoccus bachuensis TaxID=3136731 RepID=A0ABZ3CE01_9STAP
MNGYKVQLDVFEGPLDLLLHLIKELEIDIYDIPMKTLTRQYMEYIDEMKELEINVASEYLVMASELLKIKSHMLLPEPPHMEEEYEDPRESLMEQLIEYQNYKQYAEQLAELKKENEKIYIKAPHAFEEKADDDAPLEVSLADLMAAYQKVRARVSVDRPRNITITRESVSREFAESFLRQCFSGKKTLGLRDIFTFSESKPKVVAVFLTLLDLVKDNQLAIHPRGRDDFEIERLYD